jgi:CBS domain-containing protein
MRGIVLNMVSSPKEKRVSDCMTSPVVSVGPDDSQRAAAEIMLRLHVSGVPVVDAQGRPLGVVSESDFRFGDAAARKRHREAWVTLLSGGQEMAKDYLDALERESETVKQIMARPALCVDEATSLDEAVEIMSAHRVKRLLILRDDLLVGVVTRADLLRFFAPEINVSKPVTPEFFDTEVVKARTFKLKAGAEAVSPAPAPATAAVTAAELKTLVAEFERQKSEMKSAAGRQNKAKRDEQVKLLLNSRFTDQEMSHLMLQARDAARRGESGIPALIFPSALCADGGRAVNLPDPAWPSTLRGKAADFFLRWDKELRPLGFALSARIVNFPDGFPGDAELALVWGR